MVSMCVGLPVKTKIHGPRTSTRDFSERLTPVKMTCDIMLVTPVM